jgi:hypothetical protein
MKRLVVALFLTGCGPVLCSFTANAVGNCPAQKAAAANTQASNSSESSESSSSEEASAATPAASGPACKPDGTITGNENASTFCCSHMEKRTADNRDHMCCSTSSDNNECR